MKVINLWAGPGAGKSTAAAGLFHLMKSAEKRVELVTEFAKELVYDDNQTTLRNQVLIIGEQDQRLRRLTGQVDYVITDSPLPLSTLYAKPPFDQPWFTNLAWGLFNTYDNFNVAIRRVKPYIQYGRYQDEDAARQLDVSVRTLLDNHNITHVAVNGDKDAPATIARLIENDNVH
jgi:hypothetical protein